MTYANQSTGGTFVTASVDGTTVADGFITATTQPETGFLLAAGDSEPTTWHVSLAAGAPSSASTSPLLMEADLDQFNAASGSVTNLDYVNSDPITVTAGSPSIPPTTTATTTTTTIVQPTNTIIQTVPVAGAPARGCTVPKLVGHSFARAQSALKKAKCTSTMLLIPAHRKGRRVVVKTVKPKAGTKTAVGGHVKVRFKVKGT